MQTIQENLSRLTVGPPVTHENLTMFPLLNGEDAPPDYVTLDEAMAAGSARVSEISEGGSVPELRFVNEGEKAVLLLDGEELVGAKQNRALNLTILVPPKTTLTIPVSCVEQGRWGYRGEWFQSSGQAQFARGRARRAASVSCSMDVGHGRISDQSDVWEAIGEKMAGMKVSSPTMAMSDVYESARPRLAEYTKAFSPIQDQAGALFVINARVSGMDLFDSPETYRKLMPKLVLSHALDAAERVQPIAEEVPEGLAGKFLEAVEASEAATYPALGLGTDVRFRGRSVSGGALTVDGRVVHLCAFPAQMREREHFGGSRMRSPRERSRNRA